MGDNHLSQVCPVDLNPGPHKSEFECSSVCHEETFQETLLCCFPYRSSQLMTLCMGGEKEASLAYF